MTSATPLHISYQTRLRTCTIITILIIALSNRLVWSLQSSIQIRPLGVGAAIISSSRVAPCHLEPITKLGASPLRCITALRLQNNSDIMNTLRRQKQSSISSSFGMTTKSSEDRSKPKRKKAKLSTSASTELVEQGSNDNKIGNLEQDSLLYKWLTHTNDSFHDFSDEEARDIVQALTTWYRANRRKLPWRGDNPPYDGSTAGTNLPDDKKKKRVKKEDEKQTTMNTFFTTSKKNIKQEDENPHPTPSSPTLETSNNVKVKVKMEECTPPTTTTTTTNAVTAYGVWVSEIMCQQTRVEAVIPFYIKWMKRFPIVQDLACASEDDVNAHWAGLGFYRRARLLHRGAKRVVEDYDGVLPGTVDELLNIEGIGRYTASAVASIAFNQSVPVVDGNVCRVLSRLTAIANHIKAPVLKDDLGWRLASQLIKASSSMEDSTPGEINQALMEIGATYCAPSGSGVDERDPLQAFYRSTQIGREIQCLLHNQNKALTLEEMLKDTPPSALGRCKLCHENGVGPVFYQIQNEIIAIDNNTNDVAMAAAMIAHAAFPTTPPKKQKREEVLAIAALSLKTRNSINKSKEDEKWLMIKRPKEGLLANQFEFPSICIWVGGGPKKNKKENIVEVPNISPAKRKSALDTLLNDIMPGSDGADNGAMQGLIKKCHRKNITNGSKLPMEHIFSHVRHTMWIEHGECNATDFLMTCDMPLSWTTKDGREVRWMSEADMKSVGVTSAIKKILVNVKKERKA
mmetsp:Transcript_28570/g.42249  ORF Transcript_28570/g.42249 Transcript_28570/m.42249 type:complete len:743 (+) Transcript_28570:131-2359(+)